MNKKAAKAAQELSLMDHCILSREEAVELAEAMGLPGQDVPLYAMEHRPDTLKGARLKGCTEIGEKRYAIGADELAEWACRKLNVKYESKMGRGSALRECCTRLYERFDK
ncbi:MAG TPA: hypothetical protein VNA25_10485 [Phycisphaerae bacterium]|nr:hypothetical protein [Phycisphaerae bacterium]